MTLCNNLSRKKGGGRGRIFEGGVFLRDYGNGSFHL